MNMFEVWLFLTVIPNLPFVLLLVSALFICWGGFSIIRSIINEDEYDAITWRFYYNFLIYKHGKVPLIADAELFSKLKQASMKLSHDSWVHSVSLLKRNSIIAVILLSLNVLIPGRSEMVAMVAIPYVSNNAEFKKLPENVLKVVNKYIEKYIPEERDEEKMNEQESEE